MVIPRGRKIVIFGESPFPSDVMGVVGLQSWYSGLRLLTANVVPVSSFPYVEYTMEVDRRFFRNASVIKSVYVSSYKLVPWVKLMSRLGSLRSCFFDFPTRFIAEELTGLVNKIVPECQVIGRYAHLNYASNVPQRYFDLRNGSLNEVGNVGSCVDLLLKVGSKLCVGVLYRLENQITNLSSYDVSFEEYNGKWYVWIEHKKWYPSKLIVRGVRLGGIDFQMEVRRC